MGLGGLGSLVRLADEIANPWFGIYEHCYWPRRGEMRPHEEIALVGQRMLGLHSFVIDRENIDYEKMLGALKDVGYDSYWTFEIPLEAAEESRLAWDELMAQYW